MNFASLNKARVSLPHPRTPTGQTHVRFLPQLLANSSLQRDLSTVSSSTKRCVYIIMDHKFFAEVVLPIQQ